MRLAFQPLFFLPRPALRWVYDQACFERLMDTPFVAFFITVDKAGIWFPYKGDEVLLTWPWRRKGLAPFVSVVFSGDGSLGDSRFWTLKEMDKMWDMYGWVSVDLGAWIAQDRERYVREEMAGEPIKQGDLVVFDENNRVIRAFARDAGMSAVEVADMANETAKKLRAIPHDEFEGLGKAFDEINERT